MAGSWSAKRLVQPNFRWMLQNVSFRAPRLVDGQQAGEQPPKLEWPQTPEERELLTAVAAEPDRDEPRLRYAEWCEHQGDPLGAFIRAQLQIPDLATPDEVLQAETRRLAPWAARDLVFRRGFVEELSLSGRAFLSLGEPLFQFRPVRRVRLVAIVPYLEELLVSPRLATLHTLDLSGNHLSESEVAPIESRWPHLVLLR